MATRSASIASQQVHLLAAQLFAAPAETAGASGSRSHESVGRYGLPVTQFPFLLIDLPGLVLKLPLSLLDLGNQLLCKRAQMFRAEGVEIGGQVHADQSARTPDTVEAQQFTSLLVSYDADHTVRADTLPRKADHKTCELFLRERMMLRFATRVRPHELPFVQPSRRQPDADTVVDQHLQAVGSPVGETWLFEIT